MVHIFVFLNSEFVNLKVEVHRRYWPRPGPQQRRSHGICHYREATGVLTIGSIESLRIAENTTSNNSSEETEEHQQWVIGWWCWAVLLVGSWWLVVDERTWQTFSNWLLVMNHQFSPQKWCQCQQWFREYRIPPPQIQFSACPASHTLLMTNLLNSLKILVNN